LNRATSSIVDKNATIGDYGVPISGGHELVSHGLHDAIDLFIRHKPPGKIGLLTVQKKGPAPKPEKAVRSIWVVAIHGRYSIGDVNIKKPIPDFGTDLLNFGRHRRAPYCGMVGGPW